MKTKERELIEKYQFFVKWVLRYTKDIIESQRGRELLFEIDKVEADIRASEIDAGEKDEQKDWTCHCGDESTGSTKIWACNICGMEVLDEYNPDKISAKLKEQCKDEVSDEAITVEKRTNEFLNLGDNLNSVHDAPIMDRNQNEAIRFLAKQIDILHKMRIKSGKITNQ